MTSAISIFRIFRIFFSIIFRNFRELFVRLVRSKIFRQTACVAAICLVRISSKFEPSSRFFGRLKIFANFDSIDSIFRSIRSILRPRVVVDFDHFKKFARKGKFFEMLSWGGLGGRSPSQESPLPVPCRTNFVRVRISYAYEIRTRSRFPW